MVNIEYGEPQEDENGNEYFKELALDEITKNETEQMTDQQREEFYEIGKATYGPELWEKKIIEIDYYELNKKPELDAKNYSKKDLFDLLGLEEEGPLDGNFEDYIKNAVDEMKETLEKNSNSDNMDAVKKYKVFFDEVATRLIKENNETTTQITDTLIQKQDISKIKRNIIPCAQTVIINSDFDVPPTSTSTICPDGSFQYNVNRYHKTNFEVFLEFKLSNTSKLTLGNVIIPLSGYFAIDSAYNTNTFTIKDISTNESICIELEPQQPKQENPAVPGSAYEGFISSFHESLNSVNIYDISLNIISSGPFAGHFGISTDSIKGYEIDWLGGDCDTIYCVGGKSNLTTKNRPTSTLGYLMGFDTEITTNNRDPAKQGKLSIKKSDGVVKAVRDHSGMIGSNMFYLQLTDYTGSTKNHNKVNVSKPIQTFKQPYYFNSIKSRVGIDNSLNFCEKYKETNKRSSRKGTASNTDINFLNQLTNAQKETIKAHAAANKAAEDESPSSGGGSGRGSGVGSDSGGIQIRFPVLPDKNRGGPPGKLVHPIRFSGSKENVCPILFGNSTDIIKIGIALLDSNEFLVDLHGGGIIVTFNTDQEKTEIGKS